jgi:hypothetical protein
MKAPEWLRKFKASDGRQKRPRSPVKHDVVLCDLFPQDDETVGYMHDSLSVENSPCSRTKRREHTKTKPLKEKMHDALEEGLFKPLDPGNIGFQMVQHPSSLYLVIANYLIAGLLFHSCQRWVSAKEIV